MVRPVGDIIREQRESKGITKALFARRLGCSPQNIDSIEQRKSIDFELAQKISTILEFDVFQDYRVIPSGASEREMKLENDLREVTRRYTDLLERYNNTLEKAANSEPK